MPTLVDVLVIATHPDDAESTVGGTIAKLVNTGARVGILDATMGEMGTRGSKAIRSKESELASKELGVVVRKNLRLPDGRVQATVDAREKLVRVIRELRPQLLIAPWWKSDLHPDHAAVGLLSRQAFFLAGLRKLLPDIPAFRPPRLLYYQSHDSFEPNFVSRLTQEHFDRKLRALACFASQVKPASGSDSGAHFVHGQELLERIKLRGLYFGSLIKAPFGEPLRSEAMLDDSDPLIISNLHSLVGSPR